MIDDYRFGRITIDGKLYRDDVKIYPDGIAAGWWREKGHELRPGDVKEIEGKDVGYLVIGLGAYSRMRVTAEAEELFSRLGLAWSALSTGEAVREYNRRLGQGERVAALLHLTC